jgi:hypothetical protein
MNPSLNWSLFDDDPEIGRKVWLGFDDKGQMKAAHVEQNIDQILEDNAEAEKLSHGQRFGDYNRIASVPLTFYEKTGLGDAVDAGDRKYLSKVLNDPDNSRLRTSRGKV